MRLFFAFKNSLRGFLFALKSEAAFRLECYILILAGILIYALGLSFSEGSVLILSVLFIMIIELLNTAIEKTVDRISKEHHELSKAIKDVASAAVFLSLVICAFAWFYVLHRHFA